MDINPAVVRMKAEVKEASKQTFWIEHLDNKKKAKVS
jgi:hypothetical protein